MKVKLLKKLRKKAEKVYYVKYCIGKRTYIINGVESVFCGFWAPTQYDSLDKAKEVCDEKRRNYILHMTDEMKGHRYRKIY